jgi:hypothetical protein
MTDNYAESLWAVSVNGRLICLGSDSVTKDIDVASRARFLACQALEAAFTHTTVEIIRFSADLAIREVLARDEL